MSIPRPKPKKKLSSVPQKITLVKVRNDVTGEEREVTDPAEIVRLMKADGFTVDDETGAVGLGPRLRPQ